MSSLGCGPFGMIQSFSVVPGLTSRLRGVALCRAGVACLVVPAAARIHQGPDENRCDRQRRSRTYCARFSPPSPKTVSVLRLALRREPLAAVTPYVAARGRVEPRRTSSTGRTRGLRDGIRLAVDQAHERRARGDAEAEPCPGARSSGAGSCDRRAGCRRSRRRERSAGTFRPASPAARDRAEGHHVRGGEDRRRRLVKGRADRPSHGARSRRRSRRRRRTRRDRRARRPACAWR